MEPPRLVPPKPPAKPAPVEEKPEGWTSLFVTITLLGGVLIGLTFLSLGSILGPLILGLLVLPILAMFHYLLWGWWLGKMLKNGAEEEE